MNVWVRLNVVLLVIYSGMTIFCLLPVGQGVARSLVYLTFVSNFALVMSSLASIFAARAERETRKQKDES